MADKKPFPNQTDAEVEAQLRFLPEPGITCADELGLYDAFIERLGSQRFIQILAEKRESQQAIAPGIPAVPAA